MSKKRLKMAVGFFVVVLIIALVFLFKGRLAPKNLNPYYLHDLEEIGRIDLIRSGETIKLVKQDANWLMEEPIADLAAPSMVKQLLSNIVTLSIESTVSTNKDKHPQFGLDEANQVHIRVFDNNKSEPTLAGYFGRTGMGYQTVYFRFEGSDAVHLSYEIPAYLIKRSAADFRLKTLFPVDKNNLSAILVDSEKWRFNFINQDGERWINEKTGLPINLASLQPLLDAIPQMNALGFPEGEISDEVSGIATPFMLVKVVTEGKSFEVKMGKRHLNPKKGELPIRYIKMTGRKALMTVRQSEFEHFTSILDQILDAVNKGDLPKKEG